MLIPTSDTKAIKAAIRGRKTYMRIETTDVWVRVSHADMLRAVSDVNKRARQYSYLAAVHVYIRTDGLAMVDIETTDRS